MTGRRARARTRATIGALVVALSAAACGGGAATPEAAWERIRAVARDPDPAALRPLLEADTIGRHRQRVREWRALVERGDPPADVLTGTGLPPAEVCGGTLEEALDRVLLRASPITADAGWVLGASLTAVERPDERTARLVLRDEAGREFGLWLTLERGAWRIDDARTYRSR